MCKQHLMIWLSGAAGLDAIVHLTSALGWNWFNVSSASNWALFVVFGLIAIVLGYMAVCESRTVKTKPMQKKKK